MSLIKNVNRIDKNS